MTPTYKANRQFFLGFLLLFGGLLLYSLSAFFTAFLGALMFYVLSKPGVLFLIKKGWNKSWIALLVILLSLFIIVIPIVLIGSMLYHKAMLASGNIDEMLVPLQNLESQLQEEFHFTVLSPKNLAALESVATKFLGGFLNQSINLVSSIGMMYFFLYFMITNVNRMEALILLYLPFSRRKIRMFGDELHAQTMSNALGVPLIAVVQGLVAFAAYWFLGLSQAGFWAVLTGICSIIPVVGAALIWLPLAIFMLFNGPTWHGVAMLAWGIAVIGVMDNVVRFVLAKKMADVHPIVTILGVIIGLNYFGITGLVFGPLLISYFVLFVKIYYSEYRRKTPLSQIK